MGLLDDLTKGVKNVADSVSSEAKTHALRSRLADAEKDVWNLYSQMGYRALELLNEGAIEDNKLKELAAQLPALVERIDGLKQEIADIEHAHGRGATEEDEPPAEEGSDGPEPGPEYPPSAPSGPPNSQNLE